MVNTKLVGISAVLTALMFVGCSSTHQMNPTPQEQGSSLATSAEAEFNRERQIKEAYEQGYKKGASEAHDEAVRIITEEYLPYIKRLEAGKYAIKKGHITPPEVMILQAEDGSLSYRTTGCKIEKELDVGDIFKRFGKSVVVSQGAGQKTDHVGADSVSESYAFAGRDAVRYPVMRPGSAAEMMTTEIAKTSVNKLVLDEYNVRYSEKEGSYLAVFASKAEMDGFCNQFRICGGN